MGENCNNKKAAALFARDVHHRNVPALFLSQDVFKRGEVMQDIKLDRQYIICLRMARDTQQIKYWGRQLGLSHLVAAIIKPLRFLMVVSL